jgi:hypothetical protein
MQCSSRLFEKKLWKSQVSLNGINSSKWFARTWSVMKKWSSKISQNQVRNLVHSDRRLNIRALDVLLNSDKETVKTSGTLAQWIDYPPWQCTSSQDALCQVVSGPEINYWNGTPTLFPWFGSEWLLAFSENKVGLQGTKISGRWRHLKNVTKVLKDIPQQEFLKYFQQWQHLWPKCVAAQGYFKDELYQWAVSIEVCLQ